MNDGGGAAERAQPFRAKRRCATSARCRCRRRRSLPSVPAGRVILPSPASAASRRSSGVLLNDGAEPAGGTRQKEDAQSRHGRPTEASPSSSWTSDFCPPASVGEPPRQRRALNDGGGATERAQPFGQKEDAQPRHGAGADEGVPCRPQAGRVKKHFRIEANMLFGSLCQRHALLEGPRRQRQRLRRLPLAPVGAALDLNDGGAPFDGQARLFALCRLFAATRAWRATKGPHRHGARAGLRARSDVGPALHLSQEVKLFDAGDIVCDEISLERASVSWAPPWRERSCAASSSPSCSAAARDDVRPLQGQHNFPKGQGQRRSLASPISTHFDLRPHDMGNSSGTMFARSRTCAAPRERPTTIFPSAFSSTATP